MNLLNLKKNPVVVKSEEELQMDKLAAHIANKMAREPEEQQLYIDQLRRDTKGIGHMELEKRIDKHIRYRIKDFLTREGCACGVKARFEGVCLGCGHKYVPELTMNGLTMVAG